MTKFNKLIDEVELYIVFVLLFVGFVLGMIVNNKLEISEMNMQTWSTLGLLVIAFLSWKAARTSAIQAELANKYLLYGDRKTVYFSMSELVNYVDSTHVDEWSEATIRSYFNNISLIKVCFPLNTHIHEKVYNYWKACLTISGNDKLSGYYINATEYIIHPKGEELLKDILKEIHLKI